MIELPDYIDVDTLNRLLQEETNRKNNSPDPEMGNLSPNQVADLIYGKWCQNGHTIQIATGLPLATYERAPFFRHTRKVLCALRDQDGAKATQTGNFSRPFVLEMAKALYNDPDDLPITDYYKAPNEENVWRLHLAKIVAKRVGLIRKQKGKFVVPKSQQKKLSEEHTGELFSELFASYFQEYNFAYTNGEFDRVPRLQSCIAYTLYRLGVMAQDWIDADIAFAHKVLLPAVQEDFDAYIQEQDPRFASLSIGRLLVSPFVTWGLLEQADEAPIKYGDAQSVRITSLYREVIQFTI